MENTASEAIRVEMMESTAYPAAEKAAPNRLAGLWLWLMFIIMTLTLLCTGVLVAWPVLSWLAGRFTEM